MILYSFTFKPILDSDPCLCFIKWRSVEKNIRQKKWYQCLCVKFLWSNFPVASLYQVFIAQFNLNLIFWNLVSLSLLTNMLFNYEFQRTAKFSTYLNHVQSSVRRILPYLHLYTTNTKAAKYEAGSTYIVPFENTRYHQSF